MNHKEEFVIDFQAFKDGKNEFILKEIAIVAIHVNQIVHVMVLPPYPLKTLPPAKQREADWLTKRYHGIQWFSGYISHELAVSLLRAIVTRATTLFIKGSERKRFLKHLLPIKKIVDLDSLHCPKAEMLLRVQDAPICFYSPHWKQPGSPSYACALDRAYKFKRWFQLYSSVHVPNQKSIMETLVFSDSDDFTDEEEEVYLTETLEESSGL